MSNKRIVARPRVCGIAAMGVIALGWCVQSQLVADVPVADVPVADVPVGAQVQSARPLHRVNTGDVGRETVQMRERGTPWRHVTPPTDVGEGGVAGPTCLCNKDCDAGDPCAGGICNGGVCTFDTSTADGDVCDDGNADGLFCTTGLCSGGVCLAAQGGAISVCPGSDGVPSTADDDICDEADNRCEQCTVDGDCVAPIVDFGQTDPVCAPQVCNAIQRCELDGANLPCVGTFSCEADGQGNADCGPIDGNGRCCLPDQTCQENITRTLCEAQGGLWNSIGQCPCPKYGAGFTPDAFIEGTSDTIFSLLVEPAGGCGTRTILGDDYDIANGSFLSLEYMQIAVEVEADNTDLLFSFYDINLNLVGQDVVLDINVDDDNDGEPDGFIQFNNTPSLGQLILPSTGWWTVEVTSATGGARFLSTNAVDVGANNADLLWENNVQGQILPPGLNILKVEIAGTKVQPPLGACCSGDGQVCIENLLPWECVAGENHVLGGTCPEACDFGSCCLVSGFCCDSNSVGDDPGCDANAISSQAGCEGAGGIWNGIGTDCSLDCCLQALTGAKVCSDAVDHPLDISGPCVPDPNNPGKPLCPSASATYTGDNRNITNGICSISGTPCATNAVPGGPIGCPLGETCDADADWCALLGAPNSPVWFERFTINEDANVTIEYCGTGFCDGQDPGPGPNGGVNVRFVLLLPGCQADGVLDTCGTNDAIFFDPDASQPLQCDDANTVDFYSNVPGDAGGTQYWYPIFAGKTCSLTVNSCKLDTDCALGETCDDNALNYQIKIKATALVPQACCLVLGGVPECQLLTQVTCEAQGGFSINFAPICFGSPCDLGSCCLPDGKCDDNAGSGTTIAECNAFGSEYFGGALCVDDPCPVCEIDIPGFCQTNNGNLMLINDTEVISNRWADDFRPTSSGLARTWCFEVCFFNPTDGVECAANPPPDEFTLTIFADGGGIPGIEIMPQSPIDVIAKAPRNIQTSRCWQYSFNVPNAPNLDAGSCYFVQMEGTGDPGGAGCTTYIQTSAEGNSYIIHSIGGESVIVTSIGDPPDTAVDLAFCMNLGLDVASGGCGDFFGACCLPDLSCQDFILVSTCDDLGGFAVPATTCAENPCPGGCEQDDCVTGEVPSLNDPLDMGNCDAGLLAGSCTRPFSNHFCDETVVGTTCTVPPGGNPTPGNEFGSDTWMVYSMQEGECGALTISTCGDADYDGILAAYVMPAGAGCPADIVNPTACGDDTCGIGGGPATVTVQVAQFQTVYIRVGGSQGAQGLGTMILTLDSSPCPITIGRPNPDPVIDVAGVTIPCNSDADCPGETYCIPEADGTFPGWCYAPANRYLSMLPNSNNLSLTARRVSVDANGNGLFDPGIDAVLGWVGDPFSTTVAGTEPSPQAQSRVSATSSYRNWNDLTDVNAALTGAVAVHMGDCEVSPGYFYFIQAINLGDDEGNEGNYSPPLTLRTVARWADVTGDSNAPDGTATQGDADAIVLGQQGNQEVPKFRLELTGGNVVDDVPDFGFVNLLDVLDAIGAMQGSAYPREAPCDCPGQPCFIDTVPCCLPDGSCAAISPASCAASGTPVAACLGDGDGNGADDACEADCNENGVSDVEDIASGISQDCNGNGIPDECDIADCASGDPSCDDCNLNGIPDECDITSGTSQDLDFNGVPDECSGYTAAGGDGVWSNPANWSDNTVPNNAGDVEFSVTIDAVDIPVNSAQETGGGQGLAVGGVASQSQGPGGLEVVTADVPVVIHALRILNGADLFINTVSAVAGPMVDFGVVGPGGVVVHSEPNLFLVSELLLGEAQAVLIQGGRTLIDAGGSLSLAPGVSPGNSTYTTQSLTITTECGACDPGKVTVTGGMGLSTIDDLVLTAPDNCVETCAVSAAAGPGGTPPPTLSAGGSVAINVGGDLVLGAGTGITVNVVPSSPALFLAGDYLLEMTDADVFQWFGGALVLNGVDPQFVEAGDADVGPAVGGIGISGPGGGFSIPVVIVENPDTQFGNVVINHPVFPLPPCPCAEAFYLGTLSFSDGSNLTVNNVRVYYDELIGENLTITRIGCGDLILNPTVTTVRPDPEPNTSEAPCCLNSDCVNETVCIAAVDGGELGTCYVPTNRYLAIRPQNAGEQTALRVKHEGGAAWFVSNTPGDNGYHTLLPVTATPSSIFTDWSTMGPTILVSGCQIIPETSYAVQALRQGDSRTDERQYSIPVRLPTSKFGDVAATDSPPGTVEPSDGVNNLIDTFVVVRTFTHTDPLPPLTWADLDSPVNGVVNLSDAFWTVLAFQGNSYFDVASDPCLCPGNCGFGCQGGASCVTRCSGGFNDGGACDLGNGNADCQNGANDGTCNIQKTCGPCQ